jgi:hypothetical protein
VAEDALEAAYAAPSEAAAHRIITTINTKIQDAMLRPPPGPPLGKKPYDVETVLQERRMRRERPAD